MSPSEVKQSIIELLAPYFTNQTVLDRLASSALVPEAVNVSKIENDPWAKTMFTNVLNEYRKAAAFDKQACFEGCANWESKIQQGISEHWSAFYLEMDKHELALEEFKYEVFRNIGTLVEACLQPLLKELLLQVRIRHGRANAEIDLEALGLGLVVGELFDTADYPELVAPLPWGIRLNHWRNMAQHHKTRVKANLVIGTYGRGANQREVKFKRDELLNALKRIYSIYSVIRTARYIFIADNIDALGSRLKGIDTRVDSKVLHLAASIAGQGFELMDISIEGKSVAAVVKDATDSPPEERMFHASQFVYFVWSFFPADEVAVKYLDRQGELLLTTIAKGGDCEEVAREVVPFQELAKRVKFMLSAKGRSYFTKSFPQK